MKHSTAATGLRGSHCCALAAALMMLAPLAANAADAGYTDRIIVKYRTAASSEVAKTAQLRATELPAARMGLAMRHLRTTAMGSQVLRANRSLSLAEAESLAEDIEASDPNVEYAEPDLIMRAVFTPNDKPSHKRILAAQCRNKEERFQQQAFTPGSCKRYIQYRKQLLLQKQLWRDDL
jgi:hypothetical protein